MLENSCSHVISQSSWLYFLPKVFPHFPSNNPITDAILGEEELILLIKNNNNICVEKHKSSRTNSYWAKGLEMSKKKKKCQPTTPSPPHPTWWEGVWAWGVRRGGLSFLGERKKEVQRQIHQRTTLSGIHRGSGLLSPRLGTRVLSGAPPRCPALGCSTWAERDRRQAPLTPT